MTDRARLPRRSTTPRPRSVAGALVALAAVTGSFTLAAPATADTARLEATPAGPMIVVTAPDGSQRRLGPVGSRPRHPELRASPDGRQLAVVPSFGRFDAVAIVPLDGGPVRRLATGARRFATERSSAWWSADGSELIVGDVAEGRADPKTESAARPYRSRVLRCPIAATACQPVPDVDGLAAPLPGGIATSSSVGSLLPFEPTDLGIDLPIVPWAPGSQRWRFPPDQRADLAPWQQRRTATTALVGATTQILARRTASLTDGLDVAVWAIGGPVDALIAHQRVRTPITRSGRDRIIRPRVGPVRWTVIDPAGARRTVTAPKVRLPATVRPAVREPRGRRAVALITPQLPLPYGGWIGLAQARGDSFDNGQALTRTARDGRSSIVRSGGRLMTAYELVRTTLGRTRISGPMSMEIAGHEAATDAAIVRITWEERNTRRTVRYRDATFRVPLDGRTAPTVVSRTFEAVAW